MKFSELKNGDRLKREDLPAGTVVEVIEKTERRVVLDVIGCRTTKSYYAAEFDERFDLIPAPAKRV